MKYNTVKTLEMWTKVQSLGTYEQDFKNGEIWEFSGEYWYLSHLELSPEVLREVVEYESGPVGL